jgi:glycolate oxidase iron-sulfur subunit
MRTRLSEELQGTHEAEEARSIIGNCVHCGFCLPTCPTYRLLGDELDSPRGRIYLIKQVLEGAQPTALTQRHLDRCLTCRACETACPSGVQYGRLIDIGRELVAERHPRRVPARAVRAVLRKWLTGRWFGRALRTGQAVRAALPAWLARHVPQRRDPQPWPGRRHPRRMLLPQGCVQPALAPNIDAATARVCDAVGIELVAVTGAGCCGALPFHLDDHESARRAARRNIDTWLPLLDGGAEALLVNASGCGVMYREYGRLLGDDPAYADAAVRLSALALDPVEVLSAHAQELGSRPSPGPPQRVAFHPPCTHQHGLRIRGAVESLLAALGAEVLPFEGSHLCCGSAGAYSLLQPAIAGRLRDQKLAALSAARPDVILSANVGCITHLAGGGGSVPVLHWIEWLDGRLTRSIGGESA